MIGAGFSMTTNFIIFAIPTLISGVFTMMIKSKGVS
jgi:hypothetical protein